jgi:tetratricopeptide (TPR) repeat protein
VDLPGAVRRAILALPRTPHLEGKRLFSSEQLFDKVGSSADVLRHAPFLERARVERDHDREVSARLALAAYVTARLMDRLHEGAADDESREAFAWQVEAVRRHLSNLPPELPETAHLVGILEAVTSSGQIPIGLRLGLTAYAYFLEHEARLAEALDVLALAARCHEKAIAPGEFAAIALFAARLHRLQAQWAPAIASYTAAEEAGHAAGDMVVVLRSRLGRCGVLRGQGNLPASRALAESVLRSAEELGLRDVQAMAWADLGVVLVLQGQFADSVQAKYRAFRLAEDEIQRMRYLGDLGEGLAQIGAHVAARTAFEIVIASPTSFLVRTNAILELMELESGADNRVAFERLRAEAESVRERMPPSMTADYLYKVGVGLARFGRTARAREVLSEGLRSSEASGLNAWYFRIERTLQSLTSGAVADTRQATLPAAAGLRDLPAVQDVALGLREYALTGA